MTAKAAMPAIAAGFLAVFAARVATTMLGTTPGTWANTLVEGAAAAGGVLLAGKIVKG